MIQKRKLGVRKTQKFGQMPHGRFILIKVSYNLERVSSCTIQSTKNLRENSIQGFQLQVFDFEYSANWQTRSWKTSGKYSPRFPRVYRYVYFYGPMFV